MHSHHPRTYLRKGLYHEYIICFLLSSSHALSNTVNTSVSWRCDITNISCSNHISGTDSKTKNRNPVLHFLHVDGHISTSWPCRSLHGMVARNCLDSTSLNIRLFLLEICEDPFSIHAMHIYIYTKCIYIMYTDTWYILLMQLHIDKHAICNT